MNAHIRKTVENSLFEQAKCGFVQMGYEIVYYDKEIPKIDEYSVFVGFISDILKMVKINKFDNLKQIDYPYQLLEFMQRDVVKITIKDLPETYPYFIKPTSIKSFSGRVVREYKDLIGVLDTELYFTETVLDIVSEYRCFVLNGEIIGVKHYKGSPYFSLNENVVLDMVKKFTECPNAYSLDLGITNENKTVLIECNNGYSTGNYGLSDILYAKFLKQSYIDIAIRSAK
jgi:hypothetical protein